MEHKGNRRNLAIARPLLEVLFKAKGRTHAVTKEALRRTGGVINRLAKRTLLLSARGRDHKAEEHNAIEEKQPQSLVDRSCLRSNCIPGKLSQPIQRQVGSDVLQNIR